MSGSPASTTGVISRLFKPDYEAGQTLASMLDQLRPRCLAATGE
jgi:hypothetical protein